MHNCRYFFFFDMKTIIFYTNFYQNIHQNASLDAHFQKDFREAYYPIFTMQVKSLFFLSQNGNFGEYLKTKSDQNILNNTEILQITEIALFSKFSRTIIASAQL